MKRTFHRRNLPHLYFDGGQYFITYNLYNAVHKSKLNDIISNNDKADFIKFRRLFEHYDKILDGGNFGKNYLHQSEIADVCKKTIHFLDGKEYKLICYCIMPNHVHLVIELLPNNKGLSKIMQAIKGISSKESNKLLCRAGRFWQVESYDRCIRDEIELYFIIRYVLLNPVQAKLVNNWYEWRNTYCHHDYIVI